jgi:hypothetical protein
MSFYLIKERIESYRLSYDLKTHRLLCLITPEALRAVLDRLDEGGEYLMHHTEIWNVPIGPFLREPERWGYNGCMTFERDTSTEGPAWVCDFTTMGAQTEIERKHHMIRIACSLSVLLDALNATLVPCEGRKTHADYTQFATLTTIANDRGIYDFPLCGEFSTKARERLECKARAESHERESFLNHVFQAMRDVHSRLDPEYRQRIESRPCINRFSCSDGTIGASFISTGWRINLQSMGGSIFIDPACEESWCPQDPTTEFQCHNSDGPLHQLPLVAGYAAMWEALTS